MAIVETFIRNYSRQFDFYQKVSQLCAQQCEAGLESLGIKAIVTYRAKRTDKLEEKLKNKISKGQEYKSDESIYRDIIDLAGVRIALYFPGGREEVGRYIKSRFEVIGPVRVFPEDSKEKLIGKRFSGYSAHHYIVNLKKSSLSTTQQRYSNTPIEIQVASVLMHAWAEVEHDLIYKPAHGALSDDEYAILDELNGLVLSGEIDLERLQKAMEARVAGKSRKFSNHYELAAYLLEVARPITEGLTDELSIGRVDTLFELLVKVGMDKPDKIAPLIKEVKTISEQRPLAEQITDAILRVKPELYEIYQLIRNEQDVRTPYTMAKSKTVTTRKEEAIGFFMSQWIELEKIMLAMVGKKWPRESRLRLRRMLPLYFGKLGIANKEMLNDIERLRRLRNMLVHGIEIPSTEVLTQEGKSLKVLIQNLRDMYDTHTFN